MIRPSTRKVLQKVGAKLKEERENRNWGIPQIQALSDLDYSTIKNFEDGSDSQLSTFVEYCFALGIHPKEMWDIQIMKITPKIPPSNDVDTKKFRYTAGVRQLIEDGFFASWRSTKEVQNFLEEKYNVTLKSNNIASVLGSLVKGELLNVEKSGNRYLYMKRENSPNNR